MVLFIYVMDTDFSRTTTTLPLACPARAGIQHGLTWPTFDVIDSIHWVKNFLNAVKASVMTVQSSPLCACSLFMQNKAAHVWLPSS